MAQLHVLDEVGVYDGTERCLLQSLQMLASCVKVIYLGHTQVNVSLGKRLRALWALSLARGVWEGEMEG